MVSASTSTARELFIALGLRFGAITAGNWCPAGGFGYHSIVGRGNRREIEHYWSCEAI